METNTIIQQTANGSAMLAYGSAGSASKRRLVFIISIIVSIVVIPVLIISWIYFFGTAQLPSHTLLSISVTPSRVNAKLNGALTTELPAPWRAAIETNTSLPIVLGLAKTTQGNIAPFAIIPKTVQAVAPDKTTITKNALTKTIASDAIELKAIPYRTLSKLLNLQKKSDASWQINESLLRMISNQTASQDQHSDSVYGTLKGTRGIIQLPNEESMNADSTGSFFVILGKNSLESDQLTNALLTQGIDARTMSSPKSLLLKGDGSIQVTWSSLSDEEKSTALVLIGRTTSSPFVLPDQDAVNLIASDNSSTLDSSNQLSIQQAWKRSSGEISTWKSKCPGEIRFSIEGEALQNLLILFKVPESWKDTVQSFAISADEKQNIFCINE